MLMRRITRPVATRSVDLYTISLSIGKAGVLTSTIWRNAFPPPRGTDKIGDDGLKTNFRGTLHSGISHTVSAVNATSLPDGK